MQTTPGDAPADPSTAQPAQPGPSVQHQTLYSERIVPSPAYVAGAVGVGVMLGLVVWFVSEGWAVALGVALAIVLALALWYSSPVVSVTSGGADGPIFRAGHAWIPVALLARPVPLDSAGLRAALGPGSDARAYACQRPWMHSGVTVDVVDPQDPTPSWLVASRDPERLVAALRSAGATD
jgi:hypothetical protein